jgi:hypothetical protein
MAEEEAASGEIEAAVGEGGGGGRVRALLGLGCLYSRHRLMGRRLVYWAAG